jgi:hypothetical protein
MGRNAERKAFLSRSLTNVHVPLSPLMRASFIVAFASTSKSREGHALQQTKARPRSAPTNANIVRRSIAATFHFAKVGRQNTDQPVLISLNFTQDFVRSLDMTMEYS